MSTYKPLAFVKAWELSLSATCGWTSPDWPPQLVPAATPAWLRSLTPGQPETAFGCAVARPHSAWPRLCWPLGHSRVQIALGGVVFVFVRVS